MKLAFQVLTGNILCCLPALSSSSKQRHAGYGQTGKLLLSTTANIPSVSGPCCWAAGAVTERKSLMVVNGLGLHHCLGRALWSLQWEHLTKISLGEKSITCLQVLTQPTSLYAASLVSVLHI